MKLYKKIHLIYDGEYVCSTNQSKTCKEAVMKYLITKIKDRDFHKNNIKDYPNSIYAKIYKNPTLLKACFDKSNE